jgi:hypothetical protein
MGANPDAAPVACRARGVAARIFGVPDDQLAAVFASRVGPVFAEEALQAAGGGRLGAPGPERQGPSGRPPRPGIELRRSR